MINNWHNINYQLHLCLERSNSTLNHEPIMLFAFYDNIIFYFVAVAFFRYLSTIIT
jgi:hypothetical protein